MASALTYGDPTVSNTYLLVHTTLVGPVFNGSSSPVPVPVAQNLAGGTTGIAYSETIQAVGGTPAYIFSVLSGSLPTSLSLNTSTGVISGTPTVTGTYSFTIKVIDSLSASGTQAFQIIIISPPITASNYGYMN